MRTRVAAEHCDDARKVLHALKCLLDTFKRHEPRVSSERQQLRAVRAIEDVARVRDDDLDDVVLPIGNLVSGGQHSSPKLNSGLLVTFTEAGVDRVDSRLSLCVTAELYDDCMSRDSIASRQS